MLYVKVVDGIVVSNPQKLPPQPLDRVSFGTLKPSVLRAAGWYPCTFQSYSFNAEIQKEGTQTFTIQAEEVLVTTPVVYKDLVDVKKVLKAKVDLQAGLERQKYITTVPGQELMYAEKKVQAKECLLDLAPDALSYPLIALEIGINVPDTGDIVVDLHTASQNIIDTASAWSVIAADIEAKRLTSKLGINAALTHETSYTASLVTWS